MWVGQRTDLDRLWKKSVAGLGQFEYELDPFTQPTEPTDAGFDWSGLTGAIGEIAKTYLSVEQMRQLQEVNADRLARGLAPISAEQLAPTAQVGIAPGTQNMLYIVVAVIAAAIILPALMKRR